jgi:fucose permease
MRLLARAATRHVAVARSYRHVAPAAAVRMPRLDVAHRAATLPLSLRAPGSWRSRVFSARVLSQRTGIGAHVAVTASDGEEKHDPAKHDPPPPSLLPYVASFAVFGLAGNSFGPMLPSLAEQASVSAVALAPVMVAAGFGGLAGAVLCPLFPLSTLLPGGLAALGATFALVPLASSVPQLAGIFALAAVCSQGIAIGGHAVLARLPRASAGLNSINAAFGAGSLAAPLLHSSLAPLLAPRGGAASYFVVAAMLCTASVPFLLAMQQPAAEERVTPRATSKPTMASLVNGLGGADKTLLTASVMGLVLCCVGAEACYGVWLYTYASQSMQLPANLAAATVSTFWLALTAGRLLAVAASARMPPTVILRSSLPFAVAGPIAALAFPGSPVALTVGVASAGFGLSCGFANSVALLARHVPPTGSTQAMIQLAACGGGLVFAPLVAQLQTVGVLGANGFLLVAASCAAGNLAFLAAAEALGGRLARQASKHRAAAEQP